jgi:hypothetical protein
MLDEKGIEKAIESNMRRNAELLSVLNKKGVVLDINREIGFHYWAWDQIDAMRLKNKLIQNGATVKEPVSVKENDENLWSITAELNITPLLAASSEQTIKNVMLAAEFDCAYDGWGMSL